MKIRDIARAAGVSTATVSRAINTPERVLPATRLKILTIINDAQYVPNPLAKALSTGQTNLVAMVLPTFENAVFSMMAEGCQQRLIENNLNLVVITGQQYARRELDILTKIDQRQIKGFIFSGSAFKTDTFRSIIDRLRIPAVIMERFAPGSGFNSVYVDDIQGMHDVVEHCLTKGHRHLGLITGETIFMVTRRRLQAVQSYLKRRKGPAIQLSIANAVFSSIDSGREAAARLLNGPNRPTVLICMNDLLGFGALRAAKDASIAIPEELSVTGFDDIPMARFYAPSLSTVQCPNYELGTRAADLLLKCIREPNSAPESILLPVRLVLRESCL